VVSVGWVVESQKLEEKEIGVWREGSRWTEEGGEGEEREGGGEREDRGRRERGERYTKEGGEKKAVEENRMPEV
jgi:hypothetical protein